ncbi:MAG: putative DNA-binding domain-containing protein [Pseudomonadota bacterium]
MTGLRDAQLEMAQFLRDPVGENPPEGIEQRRLQVYRDLVFRNIEGFISSGFPILRSLYDEASWDSLVREFILTHRCKTPLFLQISEEFLEFLAGRDTHPERPFEAELAHYEWLELAVDVSEGHVPPRQDTIDADAVRAIVSPVSRLGSYQYPVHRIGPSFRPTEASEPTFLLVYRDREQRVQFMELSAGSARLIYEIGQGNDDSVTALFARLATAWEMPRSSLTTFGSQQLHELNDVGVIGFESSRV